MDLEKQSINPEYGRIPSLFFFILMNLVLTLSKGNAMTEMLMPEIADAVNLMVIVSYFTPPTFINYSLA